MNQVRRELKQALRAFVLCKSVLDGDILSLDPSKLAEFLSQRFPRDGTTGSSARIQDADAEDFPCLLRLNGSAKGKKQGAKLKILFLIIFFPLFFALCSMPAII